jgi:hypothetical protein
MRRTFQRVAATAATVITIGALSVAIAAPANATPAGCENYLKARGYIVGPKVKSACYAGRIGGAGVDKCFAALVKISVHSNHAEEACKIAASKGPK